jgi:hypothetical protein
MNTRQLAGGMKRPRWYFDRGRKMPLLAGEKFSNFPYANKLSAFAFHSLS